MVFHDLGYSLSEAKPHPQMLKVPLLADRIVACFIDFLLNFPVLFVVLSPLIKSLEQNNFYGDLTISWDFFFVILFCGFQIFALSLVLQTYFWGHTFGQKIMHIQIWHMDGQSKKISLWESFQRGYGYCFSLLLCGAPLLEMLMHPQRLAFYERMSQTQAVSLVRRYDYSPSLAEIFFGRIVLAMFFGFTFLIASLIVTERMEMRKVAVILKMQDYGVLCESIHSEISDPSQRLEIAIADYYVTRDTSCLKKEESAITLIDSQFLEQKSGAQDLYYLSRLITQSDDEVNQDYQSLICRDQEGAEVSGEWKENCLLAQFFAGADDEQARMSLLEQIQQLKTKSVVSFLVLQDHYRQEKNYEMAFAYWKRLSDEPNLTDEILRRQTQTLAALAYLVQTQQPETKLGRQIASVTSAKKKKNHSKRILTTDEREILSAFEEIYEVDLKPRAEKIEEGE